MINRKVQVIAPTHALPHGIHRRMVGMIIRILPDDMMCDVEVQFSRNRKEGFYYHELRYLNGKRVVERYKTKDSLVGKQLKLHPSCLYYHPDVCIVKVMSVDHKLELITVRDSTGCVFPVSTSEVRFVNNHKVEL